MSDLVGNPEDRFSHVAAQLIVLFEGAQWPSDKASDSKLKDLLYGPCWNAMLSLNKSHFLPKVLVLYLQRDGYVLK